MSGELDELFHAAVDEGEVEGEKDEEKNPDEIEMVEDPGSLEGARKNPRTEQDNLTPDHPKYKKIYGKMKEFERTIEDMAADRAKDAEMMEAFKLHNKELAEAFKQQGAEQTVAIKEAMAAPKVDPKAELTEKIAALEAEKVQARKDMDQDKADQIVDELMDLKIQLRTAPEPDPIAPSTDTEGTPTPEAVAAYKALADGVEWFNNDKDMTEYAESVDDFLIKSPKWNSVPIIDRYREVVRRVEEEFGLKEKNPEGTPAEIKRPRASAVESGTPRNSANKNKITLTDVEKELADGFGLNYDEILKQKVAIQKAKEL